MPVASRPLALVAAAFALALSLTGQQHLRFLHISDTHLPREASERYVRELMDRTDAAEVAFSIHTGDITEFGGRRDAWPAYLALFDGSKLPHYDALGNHDQTWDGLADRLRAHFGAAYYRFESHGVTFFCLNSATAQDPRPSYGEEQLQWLERELTKLPADARVALFQHHPPDSDEFATPYETQRIYAMLAGRDVLALFVGHGHAARSGTAGAWRWVMGGSTFGGNTGHGTCDVEGRKVRYVYDYLDPKKKSVTLLDEEQPGFSPFSLALDVTPREGGLQARLRAAGEGAPALKGLRAYLDFDEKVVVRGARE
ncbi:MAG: metallophosphoesterase, partial [Planctomycetes bacterium]|nr:metallophosphoesterase [Planctomycetota bacterium]